MSVHIQVRPDGDATIVTLRGVAEPAVLQRLGDTISAASPVSELLLLDLSELTVTDPSDLDTLVDQLTRHRARDRIRIIASEQSTIASFNEPGISLVSAHRDAGNAPDHHPLTAIDVCPTERPHER